MNRKAVFYLILFFLISYNNFFDYIGFQDKGFYVKLISYLIFCLIFIISLRFKNTSNTNEQQKNKRVILWLFLFSIVSAINASTFNQQSYSVSFITMIPTFINYTFIYILTKNFIGIKEFESYIKIMSLLYIIANIIAFVTVPNPLFGNQELDISRGTYRFRISGIFWVVLYFFQIIKYYKETSHTKYLFIAIFLYLVIVASLARQYMVYSFILGLLYIMQDIKLYKKIIIILTSIVLFYCVYSTPFVKNMLDMSITQIERSKYDEEDIRIQDYKYFVIECPRNTSQFLFGFGIPSYGNSEWGRKVEQLNIETGLIQADTGWAGFYWYYGFLSTLLLILLYYFNLISQIPKTLSYIKYFLCYVILTAIAGGSILYYNEFIISIFCFYFIGKYSTMKNEKSNKNKY